MKLLKFSKYITEARELSTEASHKVPEKLPRKADDSRLSEKKAPIGQIFSRKIGRVSLFFGKQGHRTSKHIVCAIVSRWRCVHCFWHLHRVPHVCPNTAQTLFVSIWSGTYLLHSLKKSYHFQPATPRAIIRGHTSPPPVPHSLRNDLTIYDRACLNLWCPGSASTVILICSNAEGHVFHIAHSYAHIYRTF